MCSPGWPHRTACPQQLGGADSPPRDHPHTSKAWMRLPKLSVTTDAVKACSVGPSFAGLPLFPAASCVSTPAITAVGGHAWLA